jgi:hypothetical protein
MLLQQADLSHQRAMREVFKSDKDPCSASVKRDYEG